TKSKTKNARKRGPIPRFPAKSNTTSRPILLISQVISHSSRTTLEEELKGPSSSVYPHQLGLTLDQYEAGASRQTRDQWRLRLRKQY
ncbi:hypothetical protein, partial [Bradyrhizobium yuanmingense]|uniref:hypothetical protein n=1 Tax=Bradyrhizobium yuanmingense TaxID=108015 RepID=UPI001AEDDA51